MRGGLRAGAGRRSGRPAIAVDPRPAGASAPSTSRATGRRTRSSTARARALADPRVRHVRAGRRGGPASGAARAARARTPGPRPCRRRDGRGARGRGRAGTARSRSPRSWPGRGTTAVPSSRTSIVERPARPPQPVGRRCRARTCCRPSAPVADARATIEREGTAVRLGAVARRPGARPTARARSLVASGRKRTRRARRRRRRARPGRARRRRPRPRGRAAPTVGLPHGSPGRITARRGRRDRRRARRGDHAAPARVGGGPGGRGGRGVGRDVGDLAQQVDHLLHVAHEVAAGHLLVLEDVGEVVALGPRVDRGGEAGIGPAGLGQALVALGEAEVAPDALDARRPAGARSGRASGAAASDRRCRGRGAGRRSTRRRRRAPRGRGRRAGRCAAPRRRRDRPRC